MWPNPQAAYLVTFNEKILNGKLVRFSLDLSKDENSGKGLWRFSNSLSMNSDFVNKIKYHIKSTLETVEKEGITNFRVRWEFLKYEVKNFLIEFSKLLAQKTKKKKFFLKKISSKN